jgi:hypothetical protein
MGLTVSKANGKKLSVLDYFDIIAIFALYAAASVADAALFDGTAT